jgi:predicted anti-sigma-YlaC factor YlaD
MRHLVEEQLEEYLSGELSCEAEHVFEEHLRQCHPCSDLLAEVRSSRSYMAWLVPEEAPPVPGPGFHYRVEQAIERKMESSWLAELTRLMRPRLAYPLVFLMLLSVAWTLTLEVEAEEEILAAFPAQFSSTISSEADRLDSRDLVMATLVDVTDEE